MPELFTGIRSPRSFWGRLGLFGAGVVVLFGGLALLEPIVPGDPGDLGAIQNVSLAVVAVLGFVVLAGEAIVFTVVPVELSARFLRNGLWGLVAGAVAYSPVLHGSNGVAGVVFSAWIVLVIGSVYSFQRTSSVIVACAQAVGLKWAFWLSVLSVIATERAN
jgi:hypothetical protein